MSISYLRIQRGNTSLVYTKQLNTHRMENLIITLTLLAASAVAHVIHYVVLTNRHARIDRAFTDGIDRLRQLLNTAKSNNLKEVSTVYRSLESKEREIQRLKDALHTRAENELKRISEASKEVDMLKTVNSNLREEVSTLISEKQELTKQVQRLEAEYSKTLDTMLETIEEKVALGLQEATYQLSLKHGKELDFRKTQAEQSSKENYERLIEVYKELQAKHLVITELQNNFTSYKAEKEAKLDKLNEENARLTERIRGYATGLFRDKKLRAKDEEIQRLDSENEILTGNNEELIEECAGKVKDLENIIVAKDEETRKLCEQVDSEKVRIASLEGRLASYKLVLDESAKYDKERRDKIDSLISFVAIHKPSKSELIQKLEDLV